MDYHIVKNNEEIAKRAALKIATVLRQEIAKKGRVVLGLPTGSTPIPVYQELVRLHKEENLSFKNVTTFNLDEYVVAGDEYPDFYASPQSYHGFMHEHLFNHIDIDQKNNAHIPEGLIPPGLTKEARQNLLEKRCQNYEEKIRTAGGIDLQVLGIGRNGHIGYNEPGSPATGLTSVVDLAADTLAINRKKFGFSAPQAISMGLGTIMRAQEILLLATGADKAAIISDLKNHPAAIKDIISRVATNPAQILNLHHNACALIDRSAAGIH